jgi:thioredoxin 1
MCEKLKQERDFDEIVMKSKLPVIVDFWAPWCGPCAALNPILDELEKSYQGRAKFAKLNVEEIPQVPAQLGVRSLPSIFVFKNGSVIANLVGFSSRDKVRELVERSL